MKATVYTSYGPPEVIRIEEIDKPSIEVHEVLVKVYSASVNPSDCYHRGGALLVRLITRGLLSPRSQRLGFDVAGKVEAVGKQVAKFKVGDHIYGFCRGSYAEYVSASENMINIMPKNATFQEAAAIPIAAVSALQGLRDIAQIRPNQKVLVYGAAGGVGTFALQIAKHYQSEVTAVCRATNFALAEKLGADYTIDYTVDDFSKKDKKYDVIFDTVGKLKFYRCRHALTNSGVFLEFWTGRLGQVLRRLLNRHEVRTVMIKPNFQDLDSIRKLMEQDKISPVIDKHFPLEQVVAAHKYSEQGHSKGKIVLEVQREQS